MNILLLENSDDKAQQILRHLQRFHHHTASRFCVNDVKKDLQSKKYDALIVDLKVPKSNGTQEDVSHGVKLIQAIFDSTRESLFRPKIVIVLSEYLSDEIRDNLQIYPVSIIPYNPSESWKQQLISRLNYYDRLDYDIAIITAVNVEFEAVKSWGWQARNDIPDLTYYSKNIKNKKGETLKVALVKLKEMGMVCATNTADKIIHYFEPKCIIMTGICAGRKGATALGDIVIASFAWDYGSGSIEEIKQGKSNKIQFKPAPNYIPFSMRRTNIFDYYSSQGIINKLKGNLLLEAKDKLDGELMDVIKREQQRETSLQLGAMATGAAVIKAEQFVTMFVKDQNRKYIGIDMETYGVYYAAKHGGVQEFFSVKCVSDLADSKKSDVYQCYCAKLSAELTLHFIKNKYIAY